jgi:hypothetical protein
MKTVVELSDAEIAAIQRLTGTNTSEEAVAKAISAFVHQREGRAAAVRELHGSIKDIISQEELRQLREQR